MISIQHAGKHTFSNAAQRKMSVLDTVYMQEMVFTRASTADITQSTMENIISFLGIAEKAAD